MGKCKFNPAWLEQQDLTGTLIKKWAEKYSDNNLFCKVCLKSFCIDQGFRKINQHANGTLHKKNISTKLGLRQMQLAFVPTPSGPSGIFKN